MIDLSTGNYEQYFLERGGRSSRPFLRLVVHKILVVFGALPLSLSPFYSAKRDFRSLPLAARAGPLRHEKSVAEADAGTSATAAVVAAGAAGPSGVDSAWPSLAASPPLLPHRSCRCCCCACLRLGGVEGTGVASSCWSSCLFRETTRPPLSPLLEGTSSPPVSASASAPAGLMCLSAGESTGGGDSCLLLLPPLFQQHTGRSSETGAGSEPPIRSSSVGSGGCGGGTAAAAAAAAVTAAALPAAASPPAPPVR